MPRLAGKGGQGTGMTAYWIRGYIRSMMRTKCSMQVDRGMQGRNTRAMNYTLDTDVRKGRGDRFCGGNLEGFRTMQLSDKDVRNAVGDRGFGGNLQGF